MGVTKKQVLELGECGSEKIEVKREDDGCNRVGGREGWE